MGASVAKTTAIMGGALIAASAAATAAIAGFAVSGIKKAADLEAQMSNIAAVFNTTADAVKPLGDLILELGIDPNLKVSTMEAAEAIEMLGKNGLTMAEIIDGAARSTVLLANATGADFATAADIATDVMAIFGIEAANMDEAVNGITAVTVASKFSIDDYRLAIAQAGGVAGAVGVEFDDFNTTIAAISPSFASGSDAGTSFKTMLQRLLPQSKEAEDTMRELGIITADGANQFFTASGEMKSMNEIAVILNGALAGLSEEQKLQAVTTLAGADASRAMLGLMDAGAVVYTDAALAAKELGVSQAEVNKVIEGGVTQFEALQLTMGQTDAAQQAATRMDNLKGALEILSGVIETIQIQIGQAFLPALTELTRMFTTLVEQNSEPIIAFFQALSTNIVALVGYITEVATTGQLMNSWLSEMSPPLAAVVVGVTALAGTISVALGTALSFIQTHMDAFQGALIGIGTVLAASTISAGIAAIAGALAALLSPIGLVIIAAGLLGAAWNSNFLGMRDATLEALTAIQTAFTPLTTAIQEFGSGALTEIQNFVAGNETEFTNLQAIWTGTQESFSNTFLMMQEASTGLLDYLKEQFPALTPVFDGLAAAVTLVSDQVTAQFTLLQDAASALVSLVKSLIAGDWAGAWKSAQTFVGAFVTYAQTTWANLVTVFSGPLSQVTALVSQTFSGLVTTVSGQLPGWLAQLKTWGEASWKWIVDEAVPGTKREISAWYTELTRFVTDNLPNWIETLEGWGDAAWQWLQDAADQLLIALGGWWFTISAYVTTQLPIWEALLTEWATAAWQWIVDAAAEVPGKLAEWWAAASTYLTDTALPAFTTQMLEWATTLVSWIGSAAADALPHLGTWLGKITGWIILGAALLVIEMAKFATAIISWIPGAIALLPAELTKLKDALLGWIAGTGGTGGAGTLVGEAPTQMEKFKTALITALDSIKEGFLAGVQNFVRSFADTMSEYIDWEFVGRNIMTFVRNGISSMMDPITAKVTEIVNSAKDVWTTVVNWVETGKAVINKVIEGLQEMLDLGTLAAKAGELVTSAAKAFTEFDWKATGIAIITGIKTGLEEKGGEIVSFLTGLGSQALDAIKALFGIESPSKVMAEIGANIIEGWIIGMQSQERRLNTVIGRMMSDFTRTIMRGTDNAMNAFAGLSGSFGGIGKSLTEGQLKQQINALALEIEMLTESGDPTGKLPSLHGRLSSLQDSWSGFLRQQGTTDFLKTQADLIDLIRESGGDPSKIFAGITVGANADPQQLTEIVTRTMGFLNSQLEASIRSAASGMDKALENMREKRQDIVDIEEKFTTKHLTVMEQYAQRLEGIDQQIANLEKLATITGNRNLLSTIAGLDRQRNAILREVERHLAMQKRFDDLMKTMPTSKNQRGQNAIDAWRESFIDPLVRAFDQTTGISRANFLKNIERNMEKLRLFANSIPRITNVESTVTRALEGFGGDAQRRAETLLNMLYDPNNVNSLEKNVQALYDFANGLNILRSELAQREGRRLNTEDIIQQAAATRDQMEFFRRQLGILDQRIAETSARALESGNAVHLQALRNLDDQLFMQQSLLSTYLQQVNRLESTLGQIKNLSGPGQNSAQRFVQEVIQPIADAFNRPMGEQQREALLTSARERVLALNRFIDQMRAVEKLQARVAGNELFTHLQDDFALLQDILMPETQRAGLISQLDSYITQMMRLHQIQKDISVGRGINPLVDRFATERLDSIARQLENINLSEAERNRLIEQYRVEQEKILALQQKQQQLDFINQQLDLINQLRSLDDEEGWSVDVESILSGIRFGVNANIDDLMRLTGRVIDELIRFANRELGIASPSKVFAKIGSHIMEGLAMGIDATMRQPMMSLRNAAGNLVPYSLQQRSLVVNMGGVTNNNGMDDVMFEARVRQIVRAEFG